MPSYSYFRKPVSTRSMGIEWELLTTVRLNNGYWKFWSIVDDFSIQNRGPRVDKELVSQPLIAKWLKKEIKRAQTHLLQNTDARGNTSCGIHIHVSRKWCTEPIADRIAEFYNSLSQGQREVLFGRASNDYCSTEPYSGRYAAVNKTNRNTVEFRMFASGNWKWAQYCVDCAEYMMNNNKHLNIGAFMAFRDMHDVQPH